MKQGLRLGLAGLLLASLAVSGWAQDPNAVVLRVNGESVYAKEYFRRLEWVRVDPSSPMADLPVGFLVLRQFVNEKLRLQLAKERGVSPTDPEVDAEFQTRLAANPRLREIYGNKGMGDADIKAEIRDELADFKLRTAGVTITDQEVDAHYKAYPAEFTTPKRYLLRVIVVTDPETQKAVDAELASGKKFSDVALTRSLDESASRGGLKGELPEPTMPDGLKALLGKVKVGAYTDWVTSRQNEKLKVRYYIEDIYPAKRDVLDPTLRKTLRRKLQLDRGNVKNKVSDDLKQATAKGKFEFANLEFQKMHDLLVQDLAKSLQPKGQG